MSLKKILEALDTEAAQEIAEIERAADAEIARVRAEAAVKADSARQRHLPASEPRLQAECARIVNQARLEALRTVMGTREELMARAVEAAAGCLAALPSDAGYARVLDHMVCEAVIALGGNGRVHIRAEPRDLPLLARILAERQVDATLEAGATVDGCGWDCRGGVVATTGDGRISLANTLSARLQRVAILHRSVIAAMLFDAGPAPGGHPDLLRGA